MTPTLESFCKEGDELAARTNDLQLWLSAGRLCAGRGC